VRDLLSCVEDEPLLRHLRRESLQLLVVLEEPLVPIRHVVLRDGNREIQIESDAVEIPRFVDSRVVVPTDSLKSETRETDGNLLGTRHLHRTKHSLLHLMVDEMKNSRRPKVLWDLKEPQFQHQL
jgi:hypothetical protein